MRISRPIEPGHLCPSEAGQAMFDPRFGESPEIFVSFPVGFTPVRGPDTDSMEN
jgi:hypothetical protein